MVRRKRSRNHPTLCLFSKHPAGPQYQDNGNRANEQPSLGHKFRIAASRTSRMSCLHRFVALRIAAVSFSLFLSAVQRIQSNKRVLGVPSFGNFLCFEGAANSSPTFCVLPAIDIGRSTKRFSTLIRPEHKKVFPKVDVGSVGIALLM